MVKPKESTVNTSLLSSIRRGKDGETRTARLRNKCRPPRSMYLSRDDLASAVTSTSSGLAEGEALVKMTESQLVALRRQASWDD